MLDGMTWTFHAVSALQLDQTWNAARSTYCVQGTPRNRDIGPGHPKSDLCFDLSQLRWMVAAPCAEGSRNELKLVTLIYRGIYPNVPLSTASPAERTASQHPSSSLYPDPVALRSTCRARWWKMRAEMVIGSSDKPRGNVPCQAS
jgi:hypothetical protein